MSSEPEPPKKLWGQRTRRDPEREFDKTSIRNIIADTQNKPVHRDYAAHFFRWGYVTRLVDRETRVLDIGCGVDCALANVLHWQLGSFPELYVGVDYNKKLRKPGMRWAKFHEDFDFTRRWRELRYYGSFDIVTCLEVVEHMRHDAVLKLFAGARGLMADGGVFVASTPVYNGRRMAKNHINEMTVSQMRDALTRSGFEIEKRFGTFMSDGDRKRVASPAESALCERLKEYYSGDVVACFLAPFYPDASRNNIWICRKEIDDIY